MKSAWIAAALFTSAGIGLASSGGRQGDGAGHSVGQTPFGSRGASIRDGAGHPSGQTPLREREYLALVNEGFDQIYNLDHEQAIATFNELNEKYGEDFKKLWQNFAPHVRRTENVTGNFMPYWSRNWQME